MIPSIDLVAPEAATGPKHTSSNGTVANRDGMGHRGARSGHYPFQLSAPLNIAKKLHQLSISDIKTYGKSR